MNPIIKLSDNAALRIKEIMSNAEKDSLGVRSLAKYRQGKKKISLESRKKFF